MSIERNKSLVRRYYEEVVSTGDVERVSEFIATVYTEVYRNVRHEMGVEGAREHLLGVRRTYPDLKITGDRQIGVAEWVVSLVTARGTHSEEWMGIPASAATLKFTGVNVDCVTSPSTAVPQTFWSPCSRPESSGPLANESRPGLEHARPRCPRGCP